MKYLFLLLFALFVTISYAQFSINELFITNASHELDLSTYNYLNWIELYNAYSSNQSLSGCYFTVKSEPSVHYSITGTIKAKSYLRIFLADDYSGSRYIPMKPNTDGDTITLFSSSGKELCNLKFPEQYYNISFGRTTDGGSAFGYFTEPSPGATNTNAKKYSILTKEPQFSIEGGFYQRTIQVNITCVDNSALIYYTLDGTEPGETSNKVTGPITISATSVLRARAFNDTYLPSPIISQTYFIKEHYTGLPVVSIITDPKNLFDNMMGIYVEGKNGVTGYCRNEPLNWNRPWERPANFEYFDKSKQQVVDQNVGISIGGACLRLLPQKSLNIRPKGKYGKKKLNYSFFDSREANSYNTVMVRNNGNDNNYSLFREGLVQTLTIGQMNVDYSAFQPAVVYINGKYWGIQDFREKTDNNNITVNYNLEDNEINVLERDAQVIIGSNTEYKSLISYISGHDLSIQSNYDYVASQLDIEEFIDYTITEIFVNNSDDWPGNNIKYWRKRDKSNKWRWILSDMDRGYGLYDTKPDFNSLVRIIESPSLILGNLLKNSGFKNQFVNRFYTHMNTTFCTARVLSVVDSIQKLIKQEVPYHCKRWDYDVNSWNNEINKINQYALARQQYMSLYLQEYFNLPGDISLNFKNATPGMGNIYLNNVLLNSDSSDGAFYNGSVYKLKAQPKPGYKFVKMIKSGDSKKIILIPSSSEWFYNDSGINLGTGWKDGDTSGILWKKGKAELGYGEGDEATVISYGTDINNKYPAAYFKKIFNVDSTKKISNVNLNLRYDDGVVIYLNGEEIARFNMPADTITYTTLSLTAVENAVSQIAIDTSKMKGGENIIAVEVHQCNATSSDLSFNLELTALEGNIKLAVDTIYTSEITDTLRSSAKYTTYFEQVVPKINIVINELSPHNSIIEDEFDEYDDWVELYNPGGNPVNLSGLYFSDSISKPGKYKFPETDEELAIIEPLKYKVLWIDGQPEQGLLHLGFRLSKKGDDFVVSQSMGNGIHIIDAVRFGDIPQDISVGRMPNITGLTKKLNTPSFGKANIDNVIIYSNIESLAGMDLKVMYLGRDNMYKIIFPEYMQNAIIKVFDIMGKAVSTVYSAGSNEIVLNLSNYKPGVYIVTLSSSGKNYTAKLIVW